MPNSVSDHLDAVDLHSKENFFLLSLESLIDAVPLLEVVNIHKENLFLAVQCNSCGGRRSARILTLLV